MGEEFMLTDAYHKIYTFAKRLFTTMEVARFSDA